jgi:hypothetical protein
MSARWRAAVAALGALALAGCGGPSKHPSTRASRSTSSTTSATATPATTAPEATVSAGSSAEVTASAGGITATLHGSTHEPKVAEHWPLHLTVTRGGRPARATVTYEFVFGGQVVARREHHSFDGRFTDEIKWPSSAVGYPLEFRAAIVSQGATLNLDYPVRVHS